MVEKSYHRSDLSEVRVVFESPIRGLPISSQPYISTRLSCQLCLLMQWYFFSIRNLMEQDPLADMTDYLDHQPGDAYSPAAAPRSAGHPKRKLACVACRRRKVRCDRIRPKCGRCTGMKINCLYESPEQVPSRMTLARILRDMQSRLDQALGERPSDSRSELAAARKVQLSDIFPGSTIPSLDFEGILQKPQQPSNLSWATSPEPRYDSPYFKPTAPQRLT